MMSVAVNISKWLYKMLAIAVKCIDDAKNAAMPVMQAVPA